MNRTGAPQGEELGLMNPLSVSSCSCSASSFISDGANLYGARCTGAALGYQIVLNSLSSVGWYTGQVLGKKLQENSLTIGTSSRDRVLCVSVGLLRPWWRTGEVRKDAWAWGGGFRGEAALGVGGDKVVLTCLEMNCDSDREGGAGVYVCVGGVVLGGGWDALWGWGESCGELWEGRIVLGVAGGLVVWLWVWRAGVSGACGGAGGVGEVGVRGGDGRVGGRGGGRWVGGMVGEGVGFGLWFRCGWVILGWRVYWLCFVVCHRARGNPVYCSASPLLFLCCLPVASTTIYRIYVSVKKGRLRTASYSANSTDLEDSVSIDQEPPNYLVATAAWLMRAVKIEKWYSTWEVKKPHNARCGREKIVRSSERELARGHISVEETVLSWSVHSEGFGVRVVDMSTANHPVKNCTNKVGGLANISEFNSLCRRISAKKQQREIIKSEAQGAPAARDRQALLPELKTQTIEEKPLSQLVKVRWNLVRGPEFYVGKREDPFLEEISPPHSQDRTIAGVFACKGEQIGVLRRFEDLVKFGKDFARKVFLKLSLELLDLDFGKNLLSVVIIFKQDDAPRHPGCPISRELDYGITDEWDGLAVIGREEAGWPMRPGDFSIDIATIHFQDMFWPNVTTVVEQRALISGLQAADHQRQVQLTMALKLLKGLQTQMAEFQRQQGPAEGPAQPDAPEEAGSCS
ncbi:hypothetical protein Tco_0567173 [Tanacetum coccineum]